MNICMTAVGIRHAKQTATWLTALVPFVYYSGPCVSLEYNSDTAFIVDRCDGGYDCTDVNLVIISRGNKFAKVLKGHEVNGHGDHDTPSQVFGYSFGPTNNSIYFDDAKRNVNFGNLNTSAYKKTFGVVLESEKYYAYIYNYLCTRCTSLQQIFTLQPSGRFNFIEVDKKTNIINEEHASLEFGCSGCGDSRNLCRSQKAVGWILFSGKDRSYRIQGNFCSDSETRIEVTDANGFRDTMKATERPSAIGN